MTREDATYYTITDEAFFVGTVALLNSLRLTGHEGEFVALDCGLTPTQRERLAPYCQVKTAEREEGYSTHPLKPVAWQPDVDGVSVMIDSDIIVTGSLKPLLRDAAAGRIAAFVQWGVRDRWFPEWESALGLTAPVRRQPHVCAGLIAFSVSARPNLLDRWREVSRQALRASKDPRNAALDWTEDPFRYVEEDALNAILKSEVIPEALAAYDHALAPMTFSPESVQIRDAERLRCVHGGQDTVLLHHSGSPKPWQRRLWVVVPYPAFAGLLPRVLFSEDVPLKLEHGDVPAWLRPGVGGDAIRVGVGALQATLRHGSRALPTVARARVRERVKSWATGNT